VQVKWERNDKGQFVPVEVPGTEQVRPAQLALLAMGFLGPEQALLKDLGVEPDGRSNVRAEHGSFVTNLKGYSRPAIAAAARAWWSGDQRRSRRRARVRPLADGQDRPALKHSPGTGSARQQQLAAACRERSGASGACRSPHGSSRDSRWSLRHS